MNITKVIKEKRLGIFRIIFNGFLQKEFCTSLMAILKKMLIVKAEYNSEKGYIEYAAYHACFEPIKSETNDIGEINIPYYSLTVGKIDYQKKYSHYKIITAEKLDDDEVLD